MMRETDEARTIEDLVNSMGFDYRGTCKSLATFGHRTLQQNFTRLCLEWLKTCASEDYRTDGRNEASAVLAKKLLEGHEEDIYLPFV